MLRTLIVLLALCCSRAALRACGRCRKRRVPHQLGVADGLPSNRDQRHRPGPRRLPVDRHQRWPGALRRHRVSASGASADAARCPATSCWAVHVDARDRVWVGDRERPAWRCWTSIARGFRHYDRKPIIRGWAATMSGRIASHARRRVVVRHRRRRPAPAWRPTAASPATCPSRAIRAACRRCRRRSTGGRTERRAVDRHQERRRALDRAATSNAVPLPALNSRCDQRTAVRPPMATLWVGTPRGVSGAAPDGSWIAAGRGADVSRPRRSSTCCCATATANRLAGQPAMASAATARARCAPCRCTAIPRMASSGLRGRAAYEDREGGLWLPAATAACGYLRSDWRRFSVLARRADDPSSPAKPTSTASRRRASADMWLVGSGGVLDRLDPESGEIQHVAGTTIGAGYMPMSRHEDRQGRVWVELLRRPGPLRSRDRRAEALDAPMPHRDAALAGRARLVRRRPATAAVAGHPSGGVQRARREGRVLASILADGSHGLAAQARYCEQIGIGPRRRVVDGGRPGPAVLERRRAPLRPVPGAAGERHVMGSRSTATACVWLHRCSAPSSQYRWSGAGLALRQPRSAQARGCRTVGAQRPDVDRAGTGLADQRARAVPLRSGATRPARIYGVRDGLPSQEFGERAGATAAGRHASSPPRPTAWCCSTRPPCDPADGDPETGAGIDQRAARRPARSRACCRR